MFETSHHSSIGNGFNAINMKQGENLAQFNGPGSYLLKMLQVYLERIIDLKSWEDAGVVQLVKVHDCEWAGIAQWVLFILIPKIKHITNDIDGMFFTTHFYLVPIIATIQMWQGCIDAVFNDLISVTSTSTTSHSDTKKSLSSEIYQWQRCSLYHRTLFTVY